MAVVAETNHAGTYESTGYDERASLLGTSQQQQPETCNNSAPKWSDCFGARHTLTILGFLGCANMYAMRVSLSVALVAMVDNTQHQNSTPIILPGECPGILNKTSTSHKGSAETYEWDETTQNRILGAFYYGYLLTQIPGGWLAARFGGKWLFGFGALCTTVFTLLTPLAASAGERWLIAVRVITGIGEGVTYPTVYAMMAKWAPPLERTKLLTFTLAGGTVGTIIAMPVTGVLCESDLLGGWPSVFYLFGICGLIWFIFWAFLTHDTPAKHPRISPEERHYIENSIGSRQMTTMYVPLYLVVTSVSFWAITISCFADGWGFYTLLTNLPSYLKNILKYDLSQSGFLSALPYVFTWLATVLGGQGADFLRKGGYLSTTVTRKIFNSIGLGIPAVALLMVGFVGCDKILAIACLCVGAGANGLVNAGYVVNYLDIAPTYAGVLTGIGNTVGTIPGFLAPMVVGFLTEGNNTREQWQIIFWICFAVYMVGCFSFILMGSGKEQLWARLDYSNVVVNDCNNSQCSNNNSISSDGAHS